MPIWRWRVRKIADSGFIVCQRKFAWSEPPITTCWKKPQKGGLDITPWLEWFLGCLDRALGGVEHILAGLFRKARFLEAQAHEPFNERQRAIINRIFDGFEGKLTSSEWAKLAKCSQDTSLRDIDDLVKRGIFVERTGRRSEHQLCLGGPMDRVR